MTNEQRATYIKELREDPVKFLDTLEEMQGIKLLWYQKLILKRMFEKKESMKD